MRLLLDTHALVWWLLGHPSLSTSAREAIGEADEVWISGVSALEVTTKVRINKWPEARYIAEHFLEEVANEGFRELSVAIRHGQLAGNLDFVGKDPFDRTLIAQALIEDLVLISNERLFDSTGVSRLW